SASCAPPGRSASGRPEGRLDSRAPLGHLRALSDSTSENSRTTEPNHVYLVDGSGYIFRAFHALPPMNRADGTPTNAVYGFTNMLLRLMEDTKAEIIAVIFDAGRRSFRSEIYADYKA